MRRYLEACERIMACLSDYLNGDLQPQSLPEVERHLAGCPACAGFATGLRRTIALCRRFESGVKPHPLPPHVRLELETAWRKAFARRRVGPR